MADSARFATIIIRILAAATMLYAAVSIVLATLFIGLVPGGDRATAVIIGPIVTIIVTALVFRHSRGLGAWIVQGA